MKRIVICTDQIYLHGGIEKVMATKVNYWANLPNVEVIILTSEQKNQPPRYQLDPKVQLIDLGVNYNRQKPYLCLENMLKAIKHFSKQKNLLRKLQPQAMISPSFSFDHFWLPFIKSEAILIKEIHSSRYSDEEARQNPSLIKKIKMGFFDWIESRYNYIVVLNKDEQRYVHTGNVVVIPNPISLSDEFAKLENKQVIAAGRISPVKQFDLLIDAWSLVHQYQPAWQLHIYGEDYLSTKAKLDQKIIDLGLNEVIKIKNSVPNLEAVLSEYSIYAMTSESECFPTVLLESLSVGVPIVSFDCPNGPRNIIMDKVDGYLVENGNIRAFAHALINLMTDNEKRYAMGKQAKQNILRFSVPIIMKTWQSLLKL